MYKRLIILSAIILAAMCGLGWLGYHSIKIWAQGLEGTRLGQFAEVAEQIRQDVKHKLDEFIQQEQKRQYTDYQSYYVPDDVEPSQDQRFGATQQVPLLRSPLAGQLEYGLAYGHFQVAANGIITTPNDDIGLVRQVGQTVDSSRPSERRDEGGLNNELAALAQLNKKNIRDNLLPVLGHAMQGPLQTPDKEAQTPVLAFAGKQGEPKTPEKVKSDKDLALETKGARSRALQSERGKNYPIESLQRQDQKAQVIEQSRAVLEYNILSNTAAQQQQELPSQARQRDELTAQLTASREDRQTKENESAEERPRSFDLDQDRLAGTQMMGPSTRQPSTAEEQTDTVQIRIEPFVPVVAPGGQTEQSIFGGQVFLLRHVQIEDNHFLQGFQLNEKALIEEVKESAERFMREGMDFELPQTRSAGQTTAPLAFRRKQEGGANRETAYTAILDFGFGDLVVNLIETDPAWISKRINWLRNWYLGIITIVLLAVMLALVSLWRNARAQLKLAQKKDDFISAVSHELRTPLTSIRMYSEMLEKDWVKSDGKRSEYYRNMRQESERLSRLIGNVLDFSRIQKGRKKYTFSVGDINKCISEVVEMMRPYAAQNGFSIKTDLGQTGQLAFDNDAVTQIVVNLLDNAVKYARSAKDKTITVRTRSDEQFIVIEVEDHGPGVPHLQRKKIFEEFYRMGSEATRETSGTGLGLALVKKFAQAHDGFVEIINAKPTGAIFRVALAR